MKGRVSSFQSLATLDGPGVRFAVFLQGCPLRCGYCHNPETWEMGGGAEYTPEEVFRRAMRCRPYFGKDGGITLSGGEVLLQPAFAKELLSLCKDAGIHTCIDTSGCILTPEVQELLSFVDRALLDIKFTNDEDYKRYVGCSYKAPLAFLKRLSEMGIPTTLRQVIVPGLNDTEENIAELKAIAALHLNVDGVELLPFRKICHTKYEKLGLSFRFGDREEPSIDQMQALNRLLNE